MTASCCLSCNIVRLRAQRFRRSSSCSRISLGVNPMVALIVVTHVRHVSWSHRVSTSVSTSRMASVRCSPSFSHRSSGSTSKSGVKSPKLATYSGTFAGRHGLVSSMVAGLHFSLRVQSPASPAGTVASATANAVGQRPFRCTPGPPRVVRTLTTGTLPGGRSLELPGDFVGSSGESVLEPKRWRILEPLSGRQRAECVAIAPSRTPSRPQGKSVPVMGSRSSVACGTGERELTLRTTSNTVSMEMLLDPRPG